MCRFLALSKISYAQSCRFYPIFPFRSLIKSIQIYVFNIALQNELKLALYKCIVVGGEIINKHLPLFGDIKTNNNTLYSFSLNNICIGYKNHLSKIVHSLLKTVQWFYKKLNTYHTTQNCNSQIYILKNEKICPHKN